jgi:hypothetical protein
VAASVFALVRSLSTLWLALLALTLLAVAPWRALPRFLGHRRVQVTLGCVFVVMVLAAAWVLFEHSTVVNVSSNAAQARIPPPGTSELTILWTSFRYNAFYIPGMVGVFGGFDTRAPQATYDLWYALTLGLLGLGLLVATRRARVVLSLFAIGIVVIPVLISSSQARHLGYVWAGRDTLPFAVGLPIVTCAFVRRESVVMWVRRLSPLVLATAYIAQFGAFFEALRRYATGLSGSLFGFLSHASWVPPALSVPGSIAVEVVSLAVAYLLVGLAVREHKAGITPSSAPAIDPTTPDPPPAELARDEVTIVEPVPSPS